MNVELAWLFVVAKFESHKQTINPTWKSRPLKIC